MNNIFNTTKLSFSNRKKKGKKYTNKKIFSQPKIQQYRNENLILGIIPTNQLYFTSRVYKIGKYNPKEKLKNEIIKINALDKTHPDFKLIEGNKHKIYTKSYINHNKGLYKVSNRILGSEIEEYKKINNNLLNLLNEKYDYEYKIFLNKLSNKNKTHYFIPKYKNAQTNTFNSLTERKLNAGFPPINNQLLKKYFKI